MSRFVLDNSVVMVWYFEDEANDFMEVGAYGIHPGCHENV